MIRHTVLFKLKPDVSKQEVERIFTDLLELSGKLQGILAITGGTCRFYGKSVNDTPFTHGFSIDFTDPKSRDAFLTEAVALPVKDSIVNVSAGGYAGVVGFDFGEWG
jgi:hypothetical protein